MFVEVERLLVLVAARRLRSVVEGCVEVEVRAGRVVSLGISSRVWEWERGLGAVEEWEVLRRLRVRWAGFVVEVFSFSEEEGEEISSSGLMELAGLVSLGSGNVVKEFCELPAGVV